ncbi:alpha-2-macroglobulin-like protein 1 [Hypomesus transpacificus]|uniref:alpha-2-macroglobulin-like protein 1 n=1 Tax=Hypomesus transpacificus TaxID=137520 RepID=UPI001F077CC5|nr:alpha-2-macroglobulin-like protein 1 [Hypomesus transpacificus]
MLFIALVMACALLPTATSRMFNESIYLVTMSSQVVGGSMETLCVHVHKPTEPLSLVVTLQLEQGQLARLLETRVNWGFNYCLPFEVPSVVLETVATLGVSLTGYKDSMSKETKILISTSNVITIIQTDKPIYKPGQKVQFRVVSLTSSFGMYNQKYQTVEIQDPNSNRIAQWLDLSTVSGMLDLSHPTTAEAPLGRYVITVWNEKGQETSTGFNLKEYVLPKFEVTVSLPSVNILDTEVTLTVCGKYTYGKPVQGSVRAEVCRSSFGYQPEGDSNICEKYNLGLTDPSGCATQVVDVTLFRLDQHGYQDVFDVHAELEESGTGVVVKGQGSARFTSFIRDIMFEGVPSYFRPGNLVQGKIKVLRPDFSPAANELVYLILNTDGQSENWTLTTDSSGMVPFSLVTTTWKDPVYLKALLNLEEANFFGPTRIPGYFPAYHYITAFYSKSRSSVSLQGASQRLSCNTDAVILATYFVKGEELDKGQKTLDFFYMVDHCRLSLENRGNLRVPLERVDELAPVAQVVVYTIMPNGVIVADSLDFPVELCLKNKVSLQFSSLQALPGGSVSLMLKAQPGSLCSVRSIDQSVLLLQPGEELNINSLYGLVPLHQLLGYNYKIEDPVSNLCRPEGPLNPFPMQQDLPPPISYRSDVYGVFRSIGMKIMTNSDVQRPFDCTFYSHPVLNAPLGGSADIVPKETLRTFFPETWIWDLVPVGDSGAMTVEKTVPDTITTWASGAFCTSPGGLGLAPSTTLTAFQPFFVSLTLPFSVIRREVFALRATVFNYLSTCIMVKVTVSQSDQFSITSCVDCQYQLCLCANESRTFQWLVTPTALGEVSVKVSAEALTTIVHCGKSLPTVPKMSRIDTVVQTFLVEAEGIPKTDSYNALLCPAAGPVEQTISLQLPADFVIGSAKASLSVLGDLMGRALMNVGSLLAMPFGCGEQNMLQFAPIVYILEYLQSTHQLTTEIKDKAVVFLQGGYQNELNYRHTDGSYSAFGQGDESGNTWLTTFVMKSFGGAQPFVFIDPIHITMAKSWLASLQQPNGCITSVGKLFHNAMQGGVSDDVSLTAYVTAALLELGYNTTDPMVVTCLGCLRTAIANPVDNLYTVALLSYTFTLAGDQDTRRMLITYLDLAAHVTDGARHWERKATSGTGLNSISVEMTSYVLLSLLSGPVMEGFGLDYASTIVFWLVRQQDYNGGFSSTQDSVVALQALAKFGAATYSPGGATTVVVTSGDWRQDFRVDQQNCLLYQEQPLKQVPGEYRIRAEGESCVFVQIALHYNIPPRPDVSAFTLTVEVVDRCQPKPSLILVVNVRYSGHRDETNMVIIDIKLLSGFILDKTSVNPMKASKRVDEKDGHVIIYVEQLKRMETMSYTLVMVEDFPVKNLQPAVVKVYDYYQKSDEGVCEYTSTCASDM